jgi:hypothetical protein
VENDVRFLRKVYAEIINGYSSGLIKEKLVFIRHLSPIIQSEIDDSYLEFQSKAISEGLSKEEEKLKFLEDNDLWVDKDEKELRSKRSYVDSLRVTKKNLFLPSQINQLNTQIKEAEQDYRNKLIEKLNLLGTTVESFVNKKMNDIYLYSSLFLDKDFKMPLYSLEEFDEMSPNEFDAIEQKYNESIGKFSTLNIKKLALSPFFQNMFYLAETNIDAFFGKAICTFTYQQSELANYGKYYRHILSETANIPPELLSEPDKLDDYLTGNRNKEKTLDAYKDKGGTTMIMGATPEDMKAMGLSNNRPASDRKLTKIQEKQLKGEPITMDELIAAED